MLLKTTTKKNTASVYIFYYIMSQLKICHKIKCFHSCFLESKAERSAESKSVLIHWGRM